jgi:hypothetical protein
MEKTEPTRDVEGKNRWRSKEHAQKEKIQRNENMYCFIVYNIQCRPNTIKEEEEMGRVAL